MLAYSIFDSCKSTFSIFINRDFRRQVFDYKRIHKSHRFFELL